MANFKGDACLRPRDLERLKRVMLELASVLDEYLAEVNGSRREVKRESKQYSNDRQSRKGRDKYVFNRAILAILHKRGCLSETDLWNELAPSKVEEGELEDAFRYLVDKGVIALNEARGCWYVKKTSRGEA